MIIKKISSMILMAFTIISLNCFSKTKSRKSAQKTNVLFPINAENLMNDAYKSTSGFGITDEERKKVNDAGGDATYGEITFDGLATLLKELQLTDKDVFYDLGSGVGKVVVQVALTTPATATGVELCPSRAAKAAQIKNDLITRGALKNKKKLTFIEGNIMDVPLSDATVIFMCSTCFSPELMKKLTDKLARLKKGTRILTLKELYPNKAFTLVKTLQVPMTWSSNSNVYWYELKK